MGASALPQVALTIATTHGDHRGNHLHEGVSSLFDEPEEAGIALSLTSSSAGAAVLLDHSSFHHVHTQHVHESEGEMVGRLAGEEWEYVMGLMAHGANRPAKNLHETALANIIMPNITPKATRAARGGRRNQRKRRQNAIPEDTAALLYTSSATTECTVLHGESSRASSSVAAPVPAWSPSSVLLGFLNSCLDE